MTASSPSREVDTVSGDAEALKALRTYVTWVGLLSFAFPFAYLARSFVVPIGIYVDWAPLKPLGMIAFAVLVAFGPLCLVARFLGRRLGKTPQTTIFSSLLMVGSLPVGAAMLLFLLVSPSESPPSADAGIQWIGVPVVVVLGLVVYWMEGNRDLPLTSRGGNALLAAATFGVVQALEISLLAAFLEAHTSLAQAMQLFMFFSICFAILYAALVGLLVGLPFALSARRLARPAADANQQAAARG